VAESSQPSSCGEYMMEKSVNGVSNETYRSHR